MQKSKLIETLRCLRPEELSRLEQFLRSPYFQEDEPDASMLALLRYAVRFQPEYDQPDLDREVTYREVFPNTPVAKSRLEKTMTRLLKEIRRFIVLETQQARTREEDADLMLVHFFRQRNNFAEFERLVHKIREKLQQYPVKDADYFLRLYQLEEEYCAYRAWFNDRKTDLNLASAIAALNTYFLLVHLDYSILHLSQGKVVPLQAEAQFLDMTFLETLVQKQAEDARPIVQTYFRAYQLLVHQPPDPATFLQFTTLLETHEKVLPDEKVKNFQALARNYCIREFNNGNEAFFKIAFDLYKLHLERAYLYRNGQIHAVVVKNLVSMGLRLGQHDWAIQFLEAHKNRITGLSDPDEAYRFNLAMCCFHVRDYDGVHACLAHTYADVFYKLAAKRLEIKTLYEIQSPVLASRLEAFNVLIFRMGGKQLSEVYVNGNKHFIACLRRILHPGTLNNTRRIEKIKTDLCNEPTVVEKEWLLDVLERVH